MDNTQAEDQNQHEREESNDLKTETDLAASGMERGEQECASPKEIEGQNGDLMESSLKSAGEEVIDIDNESATQTVEAEEVKEEKGYVEAKHVEKDSDEKVGSDVGLNQEEPLDVSSPELEPDKQMERQSDTTEEKESAESAAPATEVLHGDDSNEVKVDETATKDKIDERNDEPSQLREESDTAQKTSQGSESIYDPLPEEQAGNGASDDGENKGEDQELALKESIDDNKEGAQTGDLEQDRQQKAEDIREQAEVVAAQTAEEQGEREDNQEDGQDKSNDIAESSGLESEGSQENNVPSLPDDTFSPDLQAQNEEILEMQTEHQSHPDLSPQQVEEETINIEQAPESFSEPLDKPIEKSDTEKGDLVETRPLDSGDHVVSKQEDSLPTSTEMKSEDNTIVEDSEQMMSDSNELGYRGADESHSKPEEFPGTEDRKSPIEDIITTAETSITTDESIIQTEASMTEQPKPMDLPEEPDEPQVDISTEPKVITQEVVKESTNSHDSTEDTSGTPAKVLDGQEEVCRPAEAEVLAASLPDFQDDKNNLIDNQNFLTAEESSVENKESETEVTHPSTPKEAEAEISRLIATEQYAAPPTAEELDEKLESKSEDKAGKDIIETEEQAPAPEVPPKVSESEQPRLETQPDEDSIDDTNQGKEFIPTDVGEAKSELLHDTSSMKTPLFGESPTEKEPPIYQEERKSVSKEGAAIIPTATEFEEPEDSGQDEKSPLVKKSKDESTTYGTSDKDDEPKKSTGLFSRIRTLVHAYCNIL